MTAAFTVLMLTLVLPVPVLTANANKPALSFEQISRAAEQARNENRDEDAIHLYQRGLKLRPDWDAGLWYLGTLFYEKEGFDQARDLLRHFVAQNPNHGPAWAILGLSEYKTHEYARALSHLQRSLSVGLGDRKALADSVFYYKALLLTRFAQFDDSLALLAAMRSAGTSDSLLNEPAGLAALGYPLLPEEIPALRRALVRMAGAGTFAHLDQRRADAEKLFRQMVMEYPQEPGVHYQYGMLLLDDRPEAGVQEIEKELAISPAHIPARLRLAEYYLAQSQPDIARPHLDDVLKLEPKNASGHMLMGELLASTGDNSGAIRELEQAREQAPDRAKIRWDLVRAYTAAGRREDANREKAEIQKLTKPDAANTSPQDEP